MADKTISQYADAGGIDAAADYFLVQQNSTNTYRRITRNVMLGSSGTPVTTTGSQTLQNKTLDNTNTLVIKDTLFTLQDDSDTTKQAQFQLSGITTATTRTYTLPNISDTFVALTATQTLTNKTLTSPVITGGSIDTTTITVDTINGHMTANSGTIYGIAVTSAKISGTVISNGTITSTQIATNGVAASNLATNAITLGYTPVTTTISSLNATGSTAIANFSTTVTVPSGGRRIEIELVLPVVQNAAALNIVFTLWQGAVNSGTQLQAIEQSMPGTSGFASLIVKTAIIPSAGSVTFNVGYFVGGSSASINSTATNPAYLIVKAI